MDSPYATLATLQRGNVFVFAAQRNFVPCLGKIYSLPREFLFPAQSAKIPLLFHLERLLNRVEMFVDYFGFCLPYDGLNSR